MAMMVKTFQVRTLSVNDEKYLWYKPLILADNLWNFSGALLYSITVITTIGG